MPIGATRTLPASAAPRFVSSPVFGRWKVTVRSARTTGEVGSPEVRSTAVGVSTATTGTFAVRAARMSSTADRIGSRSSPLTPGPEQRVDDDRRPIDVLGQHLEVERGRRVDPRDARGSRSSRFQFRIASAVAARRHRDEDRGDLRAGPRQVRAATNPSPPLLPGPARIRIGPFRHRSVASAMAFTAAATAAPACSMSRWPGTPSSAPSVGAGHRLGADRRSRGRVGPAPAQLAQVELEQPGSSAGSGVDRVGRSRDGLRGHARSVAEAHLRAGLALGRVPSARRAQVEEHGSCILAMISCWFHRDDAGNTVLRQSASGYSPVMVERADAACRGPRPPGGLLVGAQARPPV